MKAQKQPSHIRADNQRVMVKAGESRKKAQVSPQPVGKQEETRAVKEVKVKNTKFL